MKKAIFILAIVFGLSLSIAEAKNPAPYGRVSFTIFYTSLSPYGEWIEIDYGVYAWRPLYVKVGWSPYLIGRWVWTPYGWYWDSFEPFGWAVYHYGRWYYDDYYGWIWIPDYEWAPAWVEWRYSDYYIGWAPLPPYARISITIGIHYSIRWYSPHSYWTFIPVKYFCGYEVHKYVVDPKYKYRIYSESRHTVRYRFEGERIINDGIDRNFVERKGGRIIEAKVEETTRLRDFSERKFNERDDKVIIYKPDERNVNRDVDFKFRKIDRSTSLDVSKIQTPRERIDTRSRERNPETFERNERIERIDRDKNFDQKFERNERNQNERQFPANRDENIRGRIEIDRKSQTPSQERKSEFDRKIFERKSETIDRETGNNNVNRRGERQELKIENSRPEFRSSEQRGIYDYQNQKNEPKREELRKRDLENSRSIERQRR
ncbi:MAG: DUF6600 domain-containing protein [Ignavibacteria bacterium]